MSAEAQTVISTDCDPRCKWRSAINQLVTTKAAEITTIPVAKGPGDLSPRPTEEGYLQQREINHNYAGLEIVVSVGDHCTRACAIERLAEPASNHRVGPTIQATFNDLRGDN